MGYYFKHTYNFSDHGMQRCRERLKMKNNPEYEVKEKVMELISNSDSSFETKSDLYIKVPKSEFYFVINKASNTIITITKVSIEKQWRLMESEY